MGIAEVRRLLHRAGKAQALRSLHVPSAAGAAIPLVVSWGLIIGGWLVATQVSSWALPLAVVLAGVRQRALENALHQASHDALTKDRRIGRALGRLLCAWPLLESFEGYRQRHQDHHAYLGQPGKDPDHLEMPADARSPLEIYVRFLFDRRFWRSTLLGGLGSAPARSRLAIAAWWAATVTLLGALAGGAAAATFVGVWVAGRVLVFHPLKVFVEVSDHAGLSPTSVLEFTRTMPDTLLTHVLHPHQDGYHLAHHLFPKVPTANLRRLHALLLEVEAYRRAPHHASYVLGPDSVLSGWMPHRPRRRALHTLEITLS